MPFVLIKSNNIYKVGLWSISESEDFFADSVNYIPAASNAVKRLQQYASRAILTCLETDFPLHLVNQQEQSKPFVSDNSIQFNISHTQEMAAAIVSKHQVGIDIEKIDMRAQKIKNRFLSDHELQLIGSFDETLHNSAFTLCWSIKETIFKWWGRGNVDFAKDININSLQLDSESLLDICFTADERYSLKVHCIQIDNHWLTYTIK